MAKEEMVKLDRSNYIWQRNIDYTFEKQSEKLMVYDISGNDYGWLVWHVGRSNEGIICSTQSHRGMLLV